MSTVKEPEVIDLDFTYGDEYVHQVWEGDDPDAPAICGYKGPATEHRFHHDGPDPKWCSCGAPMCPACLALDNDEWDD